MPYYPFKTKHKINTTATTNGGFASSYMRTTVLPEYGKAIKKVLGADNVMQFTTWDEENGGDGSSIKSLTLPTQEMLTGVSTMSYDNLNCLLYQRQLQLFSIKKDILHTPSNYLYEKNGTQMIWLQNIVSSTEYAVYCDSGSAWIAKANAEHYIRPIFFMI